MLRLVYRDLFIYQKRNLIVLPLFSLLLVGFRGEWDSAESFALTAALIAMFGLTMTANTAFAFDDSCKFNQYLRATPASPANIVLSRYASCLLSSVMGVVCITLFTLLANLFSGPFPALRRTMALDLLSFLGILSSVALVCAVLMPVLFRVGYTKMRYLLMLIVLVIGAGTPVFLSSTGLQPLITKALTSIPELGMALLLFAVSLLALYGSARLAIAVFRKKEA